MRKNETKMRNIHPRIFHMLFWGQEISCEIEPSFKINWESFTLPENLVNWNFWPYPTLNSYSSRKY